MSRLWLIIWLQLNSISTVAVILEKNLPANIQAVVMCLLIVCQKFDLLRTWRPYRTQWIPGEVCISSIHVEVLKITLMIETCSSHRAKSRGPADRVLSGAVLVSLVGKITDWQQRNDDLAYSTQFTSIQFLFRQTCTIEYNIIYIYTFTTVKPNYKLD